MKQYVMIIFKIILLISCNACIISCKQSSEENPCEGKVYVIPPNFSCNNNITQTLSKASSIPKEQDKEFPYKYQINFDNYYRELLDKYKIWVDSIQSIKCTQFAIDFGAKPIYPISKTYQVSNDQGDSRTVTEVIQSADCTIGYLPVKKIKVYLSEPQNLGNRILICESNSISFDKNRVVLSCYDYNLKPYFSLQSNKEFLPIELEIIFSEKTAISQDISIHMGFCYKKNN